METLETLERDGLASWRTGTLSLRNVIERAGDRARILDGSWTTAGESAKPTKKTFAEEMAEDMALIDWSDASG